MLVASGAKILGSFKIGDNSKIGAGSVVLREVPPNATVVGIPGRVVIQDGRRIDDMEQTNLPDPVMEQIKLLQSQINSLKSEVEQLRDKQGG